MMRLLAMKFFFFISTASGDMFTEFTMIRDSLLKTVDLSPSVALISTEWCLFKQKYKKNYEISEELVRFQLYIKCRSIVENHNKQFKNGTLQYELDLNSFADWDFAELVRSKVLYTTSSVSVSSRFHVVEGANTPETLDWRTKGILGPVMDMGKCGCCWAIALGGMLESRLALKTGVFNALSIQELIDCAKPQGCNGGDFFTAINYIKGSEGISSAAYYPFKGEEGQCMVKKNVAARIGEVVQVQPIESDVISALATGPVVATMAANCSSLLLYQQGDFHSTSCDRDGPRVAVIIAGYTEDCYIVKMPFGKYYGEEGYIRVRRNANICGIADNVLYINPL